MNGNGPSDPQDQPGEADVEQGKVVLEGPAGIAVTMTPDAARETGRRLSDAARRAAEVPVVDEADEA